MCNGRVFREPPGLLTIQARVHSPSFTHLLIWMAPVQYLIYLCPLFVYLYDITVPYSTYLSIYLSNSWSVRPSASLSNSPSLGSADLAQYQRTVHQLDCSDIQYLFLLLIC